MSLKSAAFRFFSLLVFSVVVLGVVGSPAQARLSEIPHCEGKNGQPLAVDNARVVQLKTTTPNQFLERARVEGRVIRLLQSRPSHEHFEIQIGSRPQDTLEVVFNRDFGRPAVKVGDDVEACGDYITSNAPTQRYQASPSGAIIHWVHENERGGAHPDGYVVVNDRYMFGFKRQAIEVDGSDANDREAATDSRRSDERRSSDRRAGARVRR
ncbi:MAG: hypothetical protein RJB38_818 [Pseudomonadota bacterium]|jgi:hypothetical protein